MSYKISSARYGWLWGVQRKGGEIVNVTWGKGKDAAMPMDEKRMQEVHAYLYDVGIAHDINNVWIPWIDGRN